MAWSVRSTPTWRILLYSADEPPTIPAQELPTDVQDFTATDPDFLRMSDEDIEKAIADIKAALRKTPPQQR